MKIRIENSRNLAEVTMLIPTIRRMGWLKQFGALVESATAKGHSQ